MYTFFVEIIMRMYWEAPQKEIVSFLGKEIPDIVNKL